MGAGRYFCVALPFILTVASIIAALIVGLTGVTSNNLYLFRIDVTNLSIDATQLASLVENATSLLSRSEVEAIVNRAPIEWHDASLLSAKESTSDVADDVANALSGTTITASDIGLANVYDFTLWGYCVTPEDGKRNCTKAEFDWATKELDIDWVQQLINATGLDITIPDAVKDGINSYKTITRWTEVVFIIAIVALGLELVVGLFTACSRAISCVTWLISGFATAAIIATAILLTVTGVTVIGVVLAAAKEYGAKANLNNSFLAVLWLSVAFAIGAGLFWLFSICCCKPEPHTPPIGENHNAGYGGYNNYAAPQRAGARDLAYEPYSHSRV
ncbi:hypothetical protein ONZ43_g5158 [Nemania bipapillata]|uniref:Uncharacterized protein n=1 Tax=Nemania bipapillata TaxID=110536 RepID=A0ACC2IE38_9PEZI|nr:hypothetical protein ONZ43_g5158 [Nemania bipapillata]